MPHMTKVEAGIASGFRQGFIDWVQASPADRRALVRKARHTYSLDRQDTGLNPGGYLLTKPEAQPKTGKSEAYTLIMHLTPHNVSRLGTVCPASTSGCRTDCLYLSGHGEMDSVQSGRHARTIFVLTHPYQAAILLCHEISLARKRVGAVPIKVRLNGTSDLRWEIIAPDFLSWWSDEGGITFYDYTKWPPRLRVPGLIHLTYSAHEKHEPQVWADLIRQGYNVAMVVRGASLMGDWVRLAHVPVPVVNGDLTDDRTLDPEGSLVVLSMKGNRIQSNTTGFVYQYDMHDNSVSPYTNAR